MASNEYYFDDDDMDYLHSHYLSLVSDGFRQQNIEIQRKEWNKKALVCAGATAVLFAMIFTYQLLK